jgi:anaerobic sulfite reductase subunit C
MEWEPGAVDAFVKMPVADGLKDTAKIYCERLARSRGEQTVTLDDINRMKPIYYDRVSEAERSAEVDRRIAEGDSDLRARMEQSGRAILDRQCDLFTVTMCHAQYFRCISQNIEVRELQREVIARLRELGVTEMIADMLPLSERILAHHKFKVTISGCVNGCEAPEVREFGIAGAARPVVTSNDCSVCYICVDRCRRNAILIRDDRPEIDFRACDHCGNCVKFCPNDVFAYEEVGHRIFIGGKFGRFHQDGYEVFKLADKETLFRALEAAVEYKREESIGEEPLSSIVRRVGIMPFFQKLLQGEMPPRHAALNIGGMTCDHCSARVAEALAAVPGVVSAEVVLEQNIAHVAYDAAVTKLPQLEAAVVGAGYTVVRPGGAAAAKDAGDDCCC